LGAPDSTGIGMEATAQLPPIPQQTVGGMACAIVPERRHGVELRGIGRALRNLPPWGALLARGDCRALVERASIPEEHDLTPQLAPQGAHAARHVHGLEVVDLEAAIRAHRLARGGYRKGRQGRDAGMLVGVGDDRRVTRRGPGSPPRGHKQNATFIQEGQVGTQAVGFF
jgi:hypothetical protein